MADSKKLSFSTPPILNIFFKKTSSPWKLVTNYVLEWMGLNFYYYDGLQPEMSVGIINEHECSWDKVPFTVPVIDQYIFTQQ